MTPHSNPWPVTEAAISWTPQKDRGTLPAWQVSPTTRTLVSKSTPPDAKIPSAQTSLQKQNQK